MEIPTEILCDVITKVADRAAKALVKHIQMADEEYRKQMTRVSPHQLLIIMLESLEKLDKEAMMRHIESKDGRDLKEMLIELIKQHNEHNEQQSKTE